MRTAVISPAERLAYALAPARDPQLSPDGTRVVYVRARAQRPVDGDALGTTSDELWIAGADLRGARRLATSADGIACARWSPDGRRVAYVAGRQLVVAAPDSPAPPRAVATAQAEATTELAWWPDGRTIAQLRRSVPPGADAHAPRVVDSPGFLRDEDGYVGDACERLVRSGATTGDTQELLAGRARLASLDVAPGGARLAVVRVVVPELRAQALLVEPDGAVRALGPADGQAVCCAFSPSGERLLVAGRLQAAARGAAWSLLVYDVASGELETASPEPEWALRARPLWLDERRVLASAVRAGASELLEWKLGGGTFRTLARSAALRAGLAADAARATVAQEHGDANAAGELVVRRLHDGHEQISAESREALRPDGPLTLERLSLGDDALPLDVWVLRRPALDALGPRPLVLDVHGGPQDCCGEGFDLRRQLLARRGFVVACCDPRGSDGYGGAFAARVNDRWGREDLDDVLRAAEAVCALPFVDGERAGVMGFSYGGYLAALALARSARFRAGVCGCPVFDVESWLHSSEVADPAQYGFADLSRAALDAASPSSVVDAIEAPVLLLHGEADLAVPVGQSDWMYRALARRGSEVAYVRYPGAAHRLMAAPGHRADVLARVADWFVGQLGDPAEPAERAATPLAAAGAAHG